jgi:hypothetical protein
MLSKKSDRGKCPFRNLKPCDETCVLYRKGIRYNEKTGETYPIEECALNIIADNLEMSHNRTAMMQKELGDTKNIIALKTMVDIKMAGPEQENLLKRTITKIVSHPDPKKAIE